MLSVSCFPLSARFGSPLGAPIWVFLSGRRLPDRSSGNRFRLPVGLVACLVSLGLGPAALGETTQPVVPKGMRTARSQHVTLITDVSVSADRRNSIHEMADRVDAAVPVLCDYFRVPRSAVRGWHLTGYLMQQPERFRQTGLLPADLPPFENGYQRGDSIWVHQQPSDYYRLHLVLHELVHAFMQRFLGGTGPAWYREGMAELLATHRVGGDHLQLNAWPATKQAVPDWGRIKVIHQAVDRGTPLSPEEVMQLTGQRFLKVDAYAWSWALCAFLDGHPAYADSLRDMRHDVDQSAQRFNYRLRHRLARCSESGSYLPLDEAWQLYLSEIDYGYDVAENVVQRAAARRPLHQSFALQASAGWQSTGWPVEAGKRYQIKAEGRYRIKSQPGADWWCEPGGVTIQYADGNPLGILLMAIHPARGGASRSNGSEPSTTLTRPRVVGLGTRFTAVRTGVVFLRINEPAGARGDNRGQLTVQFGSVSRPIDAIE